MEIVLGEQRRGEKEKSICKKPRIWEGRGHRDVRVGRVMGRWSIVLGYEVLLQRVNFLKKNLSKTSGNRAQNELYIYGGGGNVEKMP